MVLITVDTLRADRVGAYGHFLDTTPSLDRLAARGVRFDDATVQWPKTWPSMASMLTGTYPARTGVRYLPKRALAQRNQTLAEILHRAGYETGAVVSNLHLGRALAFDQGFDFFLESWAEEALRRTGTSEVRAGPGAVKRFTNARIVTERAIGWLRSLPPQHRFFLWAHYMDPHGPYRPPPRYREMFREAYDREPVSPSRLPEYQRQSRPGTGGAPSGDLGFYKAQYDREVRHADEEIGRLLEALRERERPAGTLIAVTADHGESLGEHGYYLEHGAVPYQTDARVPLLLAWDGRLPAGRVIEEPVGLIDLLPTVLDLLGIETPRHVEGVSLLPLLTGESPGRTVFMESGERARTQLTVRRGPWKLVHFRSGRDLSWLDTEEFALFHLNRDPGETQNVIEAHPEVAGELASALAEWEGANSPDEGPIAEFDESMKQMLHELGYAE